MTKRHRKDAAERRVAELRAQIARTLSDSKTPRRPLTQQALRDRHRWQKVTAPVVWHPTGPEELIGYYGGRTLRTGTFGQYEVVIVHVPYRGTFLISGVRLIQLVDAAQLVKGDPVRIAFLGYEQGRADREMKLFELYITDDDRLTEAELPEVQFS